MDRPFHHFQMRRSSFRSSLLQIVKLLCNKKILIPLLICYFYMFGFACILYQYGMMHTFLLKDLLFWCILVPIPSMVGYINGKKTDFLNFAIKMEHLFRLSLLYNPIAHSVLLLNLSHSLYYVF